jgi:transglutaminase-like putative cysteine protease
MDRAIRLDLEPIDPPVLFLPPNTAAIQVRPRGEPLFGSKIEVLRGSEDELRYLSPDNRGISYEAFLIEPHERFVHALPVEAREAYLALPDMPPRIAALALEWTEGAGSPMAKAKAIEARLKQDYSYDLNSPSGASRDPLDHFLFESRRGHCEYFSTAMAVLLRHVGVPTRNVTGFVGGTYNRFGSYYSIRQGDAHSWVEAYIDGDGWTRFDPTPPSGAQSLMATTGLVATLRDMLEAMGKTWDRRVVRYDLQQQIWLFSGLRSQFMQTRRSIGSVAVELGSKPRGSLAVGAALIVAIGGGVVAFVLWRRRRTRGEGKGAPSKQGLGPEAKLATELYQRLQKEMAVVGVPRSPGTPPLRHAQKLLEDKHPCAEAVHEVTCAYLRARFGDEPLDSAQREQLEALIRTVRTSVAASKAAR